ncbi:MAG: hypothetical protein WCR27_06840 [Eubacteriales bacterium]
MTPNQAAEIARTMTGSILSDEEIMIGVRKVNAIAKEECCRQVDKLLQKHNLPFDKGYFLAKDDFNNIAQRYKMDAAVMFWIYMEWLGQNK